MQSLAAPALAALLLLPYPAGSEPPPVQDGAQDKDARAFTDQFDYAVGELASSGTNPYFVLEPGYVLSFEGKGETLTITVLDETKKVGDVETRVVEERETDDGELVEVSRNYFAISKRTNDVYYFGEDVDNYSDGKLTDHGGSWLAGQNGARAGLLMPGTPLLGARHYQEVAPGAALDRAEIQSLSETRETPAGKFERVLKVEETTPLEPDEKEHKYYARGVGLLGDGGMKLTKYGKK
ncbi:MAG: hypothetical protein HOP15_15030 [Planctomycetes bacterium]|nr:hypothetical protein [Planctomycetota bacterium]